MKPQEQPGSIESVNEETITPNWKVFKHDSQAGRLLSRLYGVQSTGKSLIQYPKLKIKSKDNVEPIPEWKAINGKYGSDDPRKARFNKAKSLSVVAPKVGKRINQYLDINAPVKNIPRRKTEEACKITLNTSNMMTQRYRPPNKNGIYTDREKNRLNEVFAHKGGSALPDELTNPVTEIPSEIKRQKDELSRVERVKAARRSRLNGEAGEAAKNDAKDYHENIRSTIGDQIVNEIEERRNFQFAMEEIGEGSVTRNKIADEIAQRMRELQRLDPNLAIQMQKKG